MSVHTHLAQLADERRLLGGGLDAVKVAHREVHHPKCMVRQWTFLHNNTRRLDRQMSVLNAPTVAPPASGMAREPVGQIPQLRGDGIDSVPGVDAEAREPDLTPLRDPRAPAVGKEEATRPLTVGIGCGHACAVYRGEYSR